MSRKARGLNKDRKTSVTAAFREVISSLASQIVECMRINPAENVLVRQDATTRARQCMPGYIVTTFPDACFAYNLTGEDAVEMAIEKSMAPIRVLVVNRDGAAFWEFGAEHEVVLGGYCPVAVTANRGHMDSVLFRLNAIRSEDGRDYAGFIAALAANMAEQLQQLKAEGRVPPDFEPAALARLQAQLAIAG